MDRSISLVRSSQSEDSRTGLSFLERRLSRLRSSRSSRSVVAVDDTKGSLGLNLLHSPSDTHLDIVFVHGLKGGSRKTWSFSNDPTDFWPKEWLPAEVGFKNVRIHSYGYNSDWAQRKGTVLNVHDFGQGLLADIQNNPHIRRSADIPLVLLGHSMGGLVIKKAYLLARRDPNYKDIANRIHSLFFLGTPHRGADSAQLLANIVSAAVGDKAYVHDLIPSSGLLQSINDDFRHEYKDVNLWSFYETVKTNMVYVNDLVVPKDSAVIGAHKSDEEIGLPEERIQPMNADHRHVCKFSNPHDPNYVTIRNALLTTIEKIEQEWSLCRREEHRGQMKSIAQYISATGKPEHELANITDRQIDGSCLWLTERPTFQDWQAGHHRDSLEETPKCFWLSGKPGTGKSFVAGHVIKYLESCNSDCSYYFFRHNNKEGSGVAAMLRSMAFQMAETNAGIRVELLAMVNDAEYFNKDDARSVWRILFLTRILRVELRQPHYWVIDGLDECSNHASLFQLLAKVNKLIPLRVFVTSRPLPSIERLFTQEKLPVFAEQVTMEDSLADIRLFVQSNTELLPVEEEAARNNLISQIIRKSNGSFLWVALVLRELEDTHSEQQIKDVLEQVPSEMDELYSRILEGIQAVPKNRSLAKAIFRWVVCAARPLSVDELKEALTLDTGHVIPRLEAVASVICGYLVDIGANCRVQVVHETVRSFLTQPGLESEYAVERRKEHSRIAEVCLEYLCGKELQAFRSRRASAVVKPAKQSPLADYATVHFSDHLAESSSSIDAPLILLDRFFRTNVLAWIEMTARSGSIANVLQTSRNLKAYLDRRAKYRSPLGKEVQAVQAWTDDLIRLVASFGRNLVSAPESIHFLTPPLCPPKSMVYRNFKNYTRSMEVVGLSNEDWDDRISCMVYPDGQVVSITCRESRFAVGLSTGKILIYRTTTLEETGTMEHGQAVRHLCFAASDGILASCGRRQLALWDVQTRSQLWRVELGDQVMSMSFDQDDSSVMLAMRNNNLISLRTQDGARLEESEFYDMNEDGEDTVYRRPPTHACFCPELSLLGVAYRQRPVSFWDLETKTWLSHFHKGNPNEYPGPLLVGLTINPNPNLELAAASYQDGDLVVFNPFDGKQQAVVETSAQVLVPSPDGKTLATGDGNGMIQLFNFETLRLLYRITAYDFDIRAIVFTSDSLRFFDIRGNHCNVWEPTVLVRKPDPDESSSEPYSDEVAPSALLQDATSWSDDLSITAMCEHHDGRALFCGRENGSVAVFDVRTGKQIQQLVGYSMVAISVLEWCATAKLLASADVSSRVVVRRVVPAAAGRWRAGAEVVDRRAERSVRQLLLSPAGTLLLVSTDESDEVWGMDGTLVGSQPHSGVTARRWINHPASPQHLLLVAGGRAHLFEWESFLSQSRQAGIPLGADEDSSTSDVEVVSSRTGRSLCVRLPRPMGSNLPELHTYLAASIRAAAEAVEPVGAYSALAGRIKTIVGVYRSSVLFLDLDGWLCSVNMDACVSETHYARHFFIPFSWHNVGDLLFSVTAAGSVALAHMDEVVVFHNGLDFFEQPIAFASAAPGGTRPGARSIRSDPGPSQIPSV